MGHGGRARAALIAVTTLALAFAFPAAGAPARTGPGGPAFYRPPQPIPGAAHGALIWSRRATGLAALPGASRTDLVLYRSTSTAGRPIAVSGTVSIPRGHAPKGGWPVITWAHGTTGIADTCAPSRAGDTKAVNAFTTYAFPTLQRWLKAGYAVVRTDYEGLGTPRPHPYLIGRSEGRSVLDVVRAARVLRPTLSRKVVIAGHSQGGQAALWAASLARSWTPDLDVRGTVAFAPVSHLDQQAALLPALTSPGGGLSGLLAMILRGIDVGAPAAGVVGMLSDQARALYPQTLTRCLPELGAPDSFGGLSPAQLLRPGADTTGLRAVLRANGAESVRVRRPLLIEQGAADTTVFPQFTDALATELKAKGTGVRYRKLAGVGHGDVVSAAATDATSWIRSRFGRG